MGLDDIAAGIHGTFQVLDEIEAIVSAGTKVTWTTSSRKASMKSAWKSCSNFSRSQKTKVLGPPWTSSTTCTQRKSCDWLESSSCAKSRTDQLRRQRLTVAAA